MPEKKPFVFTDLARRLTRGILDPIGMALHRIGVHPDTVTVAGLLIVLLGGYLIAQGEFQLAAIVMLIGLPLDAIDGAVARAMQRQDSFGAVLDSTLDRYADAVIFASLGYYFAVQGRFGMMLLAMAALAGSFLVSYVRARAEGVGISIKEGLFTRLERLAIIIFVLLVPSLLDWGVLLLAVGTNFTSLQRLFYVYQKLHHRDM